MDVKANDTDIGIRIRSPAVNTKGQKTGAAALCPPSQSIPSSSAPMAGVDTKYPSPVTTVKIAIPTDGKSVKDDAAFNERFIEVCTHLRKSKTATELKEKEKDQLLEMLEWTGWTTLDQIHREFTPGKEQDMLHGEVYSLFFLRALRELTQRQIIQMNQMKSGKEQKVVTRVSHFSGPSHYSADGATNYFPCPLPFISNDKNKIMTVVVPFFNEPRAELERTLLSLSAQTDLEMLNIRLHFLLVGDGWFKMDKSTKSYLSNMFQVDMNKHFPEDTKSNGGPATGGATGNVDTVIFQRMTIDTALNNDEKKHIREENKQEENKKEEEEKKKTQIGTISPVFIDSAKKVQMYISLLIKRDNRRKHNSHLWFLAEFAERYKSDYVFLTDCGTLFSPNCLFRLLLHLTTSGHLSGVCGRQRVMTAQQQGLETESFLDGLTRAAQRFDYESSTSVFTGAFSLGGMLPVIPGPCGLYRFSSIKGQSIPFYLAWMHENPDTMGLLKSTLLLAEDRILSYAAVVNATPPACQTAYVPDATFYFEAETDPTRLLTQRRRWINGTIAGYIWLLKNIHLLLKSPLNFMQKSLLILLICCQLIMYGLMALAPSLFTITFRLALRDQFWQFSEMTQNTLWISYSLIYLVFVISHARLTGTKKVIPWMYYAVVCINICMMVFIIIWQIITDIHYGFTLNVFFILANTFIPFILALFHSPTSFIHMIKSFIQFLLYLPTMIVFFGGYSFARIHDLSWGNRPSEVATHAITGKEALPSKSAMSSSTEEINNIKAKILRVSRWICGTFIICNGIFVLVFVDLLNSGGSLVLLILSVFLFGFTLIQMVLSFFFFCNHNSSRLWMACSYVWSVFLCCRSRASFYRERTK